jgi:CubicO group peptidase (beta-lactamase class C family)
MRRLFLFFLLLLISTSAGFSQKAGGQQTVRRIENYLNELEKVGFSGSVLVELNGKKAISKGFGYRDAARKLKNTPETVFDIGSITKQFTAAAILKLEMQGKLSTDDKISKYFSSVPADKAEITIHDLLRHSSGLPSVVGGDFDKISEGEFVEKVFQTPLRFPVGARFGYSNVGYSLLGLIVEKVSGTSYERYLYENLWKPAGMETTGYTRPAFAKNLIAVGYQGDERWGTPTEKAWDKDAPFWHLKANGGILSTTEDLYKWNLALSTDKILSKAAKQKYYHPKLRPNENDNPYYAYGWDVFKTKRNTFLARHNGTNRVFYADFHRFLDEKIAIIILSNKAHENFFRANDEISKIIFDPAFEPLIPVADNAANRAFTDEIIKITLEKGFQIGADAYKKRNPAVNLLERVVNEKGYNLLSDKNFTRAIEIFKLNTLAFPKSTIAFESLGEAYMEAGNKDLAIENLKKSLQLNPDNRNSEELLKRLAGKQ